MKNLVLVLTIIYLTNTGHAQTALDGHAANLENTSIVVSIEQEKWLDSNVYQFLAITLKQPFYSTVPKHSTHEFSNYGISMSKWSKIDAFWLIKGDCNLHPVRYLYYRDSSQLYMRALYLMDDFNLATNDSTKMTIETSSGYANQSNMTFQHYQKKVKLAIEPTLSSVPNANTEWFAQWMSTKPEYFLLDVPRYQWRNVNNACK